MTRLYTNDATTTLASAITTTGQTSIAVSDGSLFPNPAAPDYFTVTITQPSGTETSWEEVKVTARSGNTLTVVRAQESTTATTWAAGDKVELRWTAAAAIAGANVAQTGEAILDFGTGENITSVTLTGLPDIKTSSQVDAWIQIKASSDHNAYEHGIVEMTVRAGNVVEGVGFDIIGVSTQLLSGQWAIQYAWIS